MRQIFIDTSAWVAIEDKSAGSHAAALAFKGNLPEDYRLVTSTYVLDETYTLLLLDLGYAIR